MSSIVMRTGYLAIPDYFATEEAKPQETFMERLERKRLSQCGHYMLLARRKLDCPVQYQGVLVTFTKKEI